MSLSEAENQELCMADLAAATALSASRITRVVDALQSRGQVVKRRCEADARGNVATLTPEGPGQTPRPPTSESWRRSRNRRDAQGGSRRPYRPRSRS
ncbi:MarR family transcriptional regulator [Streptomyces sp. Agncl-13]|uniref:MarR family transcriptional regulator n=1 Tax=Streptomyces sp. Agncl-13 TaxID=3400628 RepID=UPI003A866399